MKIENIKIVSHRVGTKAWLKYLISKDKIELGKVVDGDFVVSINNESLFCVYFTESKGWTYSHLGSCSQYGGNLHDLNMMTTAGRFELETIAETLVSYLDDNYSEVEEESTQDTYKFSVSN